jgi:uncharacterized protein (DUF433 family)
MNPRISIDAQVQHGRPVIKGTRVPVARIVGSLGGGMSREEIVREYGVTMDDIIAAIDYTVGLVEQQQLRPISN